MRKSLFSAALVLGCSLLMAACTNSDPKTNELLAQITITHATQKVIEAGSEPAARAVKLHDIAVEARALLDGENVTLPLLEKVVRDRLTNQNLTPADLALIDSLVRTIGYELARRVGSEHIDSEQRIALAQVIDLVIASASLYLPKNPDPGTANS